MLFGPIIGQQHKVPNVRVSLETRLAREAVLAGALRTFDLTPSHEAFVGAIHHTAIASLKGTRPMPPTGPTGR